jgi:RNA polymerase primary sigma factor
MTQRLLTPADVTRLARRIERGDQAAKDEMIVSNLGLVHSLAARYTGRGAAFADLVQEGTVGLMRAVERFDHRRGVKFSTYAGWWIRRSLLDALSAERAISIPPVARRQIAAIERTRDELRRSGPRVATDEAIAERTGLSARAVETLRAAPHVSASLEEPVGDDFASLGDLIADPNERGAPEQAEDSETRREVWSMLRLLPKCHRRVLVGRYGLIGGRRQTHEEIGAALGVGKERSRQLEREALRRLREIADRLPRAA